MSILDRLPEAKEVNIQITKSDRGRSVRVEYTGNFEGTYSGHIFRGIQSDEFEGELTFSRHSEHVEVIDEITYPSDEFIIKRFTDRVTRMAFK